MKTIKKYFYFLMLLTLMVSISSCSKSVTGPDAVWIGTWVTGSNNATLTIKSDGSGTYYSSTGYSTTNIRGNVVFATGSLEIVAFLANKKFIINSQPVSCDPTLNIYMSSTSAQLNSAMFYKIK